MGPFGAGISAQRSYNQDGGRARASAQIIVDNPMLQAMAAMFANPTMAANSGYERLSIDGLNQPAFIKYDEDRKRGEVVILLAGRVYLKVSASRIESDDVLKDLANGWNIKKIKEVAEIQ